MEANMKAINYIPELGQAVFGQPTKQYSCPEYIESLLRGLSNELGRVMWNKNQEEYKSPFDNTGNKYKNDIFEVEAYSWNEDYEQPYNFKCGDLEISWYKYLGRGMSINKEVTEKEMVGVFNRCMESIRSLEQHQ